MKGNKGPIKSPSTSDYKAQGLKKMEQYISDLCKHESFKHQIQKARTRFNIPMNGFKLHYDKRGYSEPFAKYISSKNQRELYLYTRENLCKKFYLHPFYYADRLIHFILFNSDINNWTVYCEDGGVCQVREPIEDGPGYDEYDNQYFPVAIRISPYATQRDLIDFIKNKTTWAHIADLQSKYQDEHLRLGKLRKRDSKIQERNEFIYKNRHLPFKKIAALLEKKYVEEKHHLDEGAIGKIISLETKERKALSLRIKRTALSS